MMNAHPGENILSLMLNTVYGITARVRMGRWFGVDVLNEYNGFEGKYRLGRHFDYLIFIRKECV